MFMVLCCIFTASNVFFNDCFVIRIVSSTLFQKSVPVMTCMNKCVLYVWNNTEMVFRLRNFPKIQMSVKSRLVSLEKFRIAA
jgi:hypothetical protein